MAASQFFLPFPRSAPLRRGPGALPPAALHLLLMAAGGAVCLAERGGAVLLAERRTFAVTVIGRRRMKM